MVQLQTMKPCSQNYLEISKKLENFVLLDASRKHWKNRIWGKLTPLENRKKQSGSLLRLKIQVYFLPKNRIPKNHNHFLSIYRKLKFGQLATLFGALSTKSSKQRKIEKKMEDGNLGDIGLGEGVDEYFDNVQDDDGGGGREDEAQEVKLGFFL